ncbi:hypothetical protein LCGC14_2274890 [marine sediment metagenome]|uniref:Lipoprotein n=1 Tax=marine sediment metagenome TaxID=412755 RepID=A0A0F9CW26_9ZZZZ
MSLKKLKTIALACLVAMLMASCGGVTLQSDTIKLTKKQIEEARKQIEEAREKAEEARKKAEEAGEKVKEEPFEEKPLPRATPQVSEDILFTLIYYVGISRKDKRRAVILDLDDDGIEFIPTVRDFEYEILQNVSMEEAIYETEIFFGHEGLITNYYFKKVVGLDGSVIGYEIRPTYIRQFYGHSDPLDIKYSFNRRRVSVFIRLKSRP